VCLGRPLQREGLADDDPEAPLIRESREGLEAHVVGLNQKASGPFGLLLGGGQHPTR
jgi:hypothetical protein